MTKNQSNKPLVSCITPCFKMGRYLKLFLEELPKQTIFNQLQVVLDHNEPTDEELGWVEDFCEKYPGVVKHIITIPVEPIGTSMNRCIMEADADLVAIWNVDDLRTPNSLEKQVQVLLDNPDCGISHGNFVIVNSFPCQKGKFVDNIPYTRISKEYTRSMLLGPFFMWRKEICKVAGMFDEQLKSGADFDLAIRLAIHAKIGIAHGVLGYYLDEGLGASTRGDGRQPLERTLIETRYGITDKLDPGWVRNLRERPEYKIDQITFGGIDHDVGDFIPNYDDFKVENSKP